MKPSKQPKRPKEPTEPKEPPANSIYDVPTLPHGTLVQDIGNLLQYLQIPEHARSQVSDVLHGRHVNNIDRISTQARRERFSELINGLLSAPLSHTTGPTGRYYLHQLFNQLCTESRTEVLFILARDAFSHALLDMFSTLQGPQVDLSEVTPILEKMEFRKIHTIDTFHAHIAEIHSLAQTIRLHKVKDPKQLRRDIWNAVSEPCRFIDSASQSAIATLTLELGHQAYLRLVSPTVRVATNLSTTASKKCTNKEGDSAPTV